MRYYLIIITNPTTGKELIRFTTQNIDGSNNLSALQIEFDLLVYQLNDRAGGSTLKINGIGINQIGQSSQYNGMFIQIYLGMSKGLPLSNPKQAGLVLEGTIQRCYGNWMGTQQDINFIIVPPSGTQQAPRNLILNWNKGQELATVIKNTLNIAFPDYTVNIQIKNNLVLSNDEKGYFQTTTQFAKYIKEVSQHIVKDATYQGVCMTIGNKLFNVFDGTSEKTPLAIDFNDMIGQPVWSSLNQIQFRTVLRADINVGDYVQLPKSIATNTPQSFSEYRDQSVFQGVFQIFSMRHVGNSRGLSGSDWITIFDCYTTTTVK